ncbi:hypothetical protein IWX49DRAFT_45154 [Phyllosticta citricarpa]|uniref:Uncharacterized protein n=1 Tax=Phyllosticta citricarpa TaxID=55181 RepID=A0ABR1MJK3_9PEZI
MELVDLNWHTHHNAAEETGLAECATSPGTSITMETSSESGSSLSALSSSSSSSSSSHSSSSSSSSPSFSSSSLSSPSSEEDFLTGNSGFKLLQKLRFFVAGQRICCTEDGEHVDQMEMLTMRWMEDGRKGVQVRQNRALNPPRRKCRFCKIIGRACETRGHHQPGPILWWDPKTISGFNAWIYQFLRNKGVNQRCEYTKEEKDFLRQALESRQRSEPKQLIPWKFVQKTTTDFNSRFENQVVKGVSRQSRPPKAIKSALRRLKIEGDRQ